MPQRNWLMTHRKPTGVARVSSVPAGSIVQANLLSLMHFVQMGSLMLIGTELAVPISIMEPASLSMGAFTVFGRFGTNEWSTSVDIDATNGYVLLPTNAYLSLCQVTFPLEKQQTINALTLELLLGRRCRFGANIGWDWLSNSPINLFIRNFINHLSVELYIGARLVWSNAITLSGQEHNTSLFYTPLRFGIVTGHRTGPLYGSIRSGTGIYAGYEQVLLLIGLTQLPVMLSFPSSAIQWYFGSFWLEVDPFFAALSYESEGDSWLRIWAHKLVGSQLEFVPERSEYTWLHQDCRVYNAALTKSSGTLIVSWDKRVMPIIGRLVYGTIIQFPVNPFFYEAPIAHLSYTAELTSDAITANSTIELVPFRLTDWTTYQWVAYPLALFEVSLMDESTTLGRLFVGARVGLSVQSERMALRATLSLTDNQALLKRMAIDTPVNYDYWSSEDAAKNLLARFGLKFIRHPSAANVPLFPEFYQERSLVVAWSPRLGETVLDFFNRIATLNGWRVDWTVYGTVIAYPKWEPIGRVWQAYWPTPDQALVLSDVLVSRLNVSISDYERRNILVLYGVDAMTMLDVVKVFADLEAFLVPASDRYLPFAVPAFIKFDKPIPQEWMDYLGQKLSERLFVTPFEIEFVMPLMLDIRPSDRIQFVNANPMNFHRYEFLVTRVRHEIGREYSTIVSAFAFRQIEGR